MVTDPYARQAVGASRHLASSSLSSPEWHTPKDLAIAFAEAQVSAGVLIIDRVLFQAEAL